MKALLLAAGYATRLRPLTHDVAKPLLPVAERPMVDWILDRIDESGEIDSVHLVTNAVYAPAFERWAADRGVTVHDDGTSSNETRLGALGDIRLAVEARSVRGCSGFSSIPITRSSPSSSTTPYRLARLGSASWWTARALPPLLRQNPM